MSTGKSYPGEGEIRGRGWTGERSKPIINHSINLQFSYFCINMILRKQFLSYICNNI